MTFGKSLREIRKRRDLTQSELSRLAKIPQSTISDLEKNKYLPDVLQAKKLAAALGVTVGELLGEFRPTGTDGQ